MFKTTADIYKALLEGKKITSHYLSTSSCYIYLKNGTLVNDADCDVAWGLSSPESWQEYVEPRWYDNIPALGILCWVWDHDLPKEYVSLIHKKVKDLMGKEVFYETDTCFWDNAIPLTPEEVEGFIYRGD